MTNKIVLFSALLFLLISCTISKDKTIYCIKHTYFHTLEAENNNLDNVKPNYLRTLYYEICSDTFSLLKQWQYNSKKQPVSQMLAYTNQLQKQKMELTWEQENELEEYTFYLTSYDSVLNNNFSFYAYTRGNKLRTVEYKTWQIEKDSVLTKTYNVENGEEIISNLRNWMSKDRSLQDSLSTPNFPEQINLRKEELHIKKDSIQPIYSEAHRPHVQSFECGDKKVPKNIRKNSRLDRKNSNSLHEKRFLSNQYIKTVYDIYFH